MLDAYAKANEPAGSGIFVPEQMMLAGTTALRKAAAPDYGRLAPIADEYIGASLSCLSFTVA